MARRLIDRIPNKRAALARVLGGTGLLATLERIAAARHDRPALAVFTYHRIAVPGVEADPYYDPVISATPEGFRGQVEALARRFRPVGLDEVHEDGTGPPPAGDHRPPALITFDDGYRDNVDAAWPILKAAGVPAAFFLPTGIIDAPRLPWWDQVAFAIKRTRCPALRLERHPDDPAPIAIELGPEPPPPRRTAAIMRVIGAFLAHEVPDEAWFLARLAQAAEVAIDAEALGRGHFMTWGDARRLAESGMSIGSHGLSHRALGTLPAEAQREELVASRRTISERIGRHPAAVAYPYGWPGSFTATTTSLAAEAGYRLGFTSREGVNRPGSPGFAPLELRRLNVGTGDTPPLLRARVAMHAALGRSVV
ncbi:Polysaccharide deacetylase [Aquisphaera giovannonii]|uniref:Polysaccharide deacetylase n=1 Tax=Aquisphaera giovannonii TaxID=406548 RepID=A0A5B9WGG8_9BACT|nr:polysaccharide deacetylase family protein [Aquisphaera giovannonii]QEH39105.1 Polysaccharide deacetylase [Aquisphaera giovannonii]